MTAQVDIWLRGTDFATTETIEGIAREPGAWTDDDVRVLLAEMLHAMDRQEMADTIQAGQAAVAESHLGPDNMEWRYVEGGIVRYEYDSRKAAQIIQDLGYVKGPDGFFRDAAGERLSVDLRLGPAPVNQKPGLAITDYWQRVGVGVDVNTMALQRQQDREYNNSYPNFYLIRPNRALTDFASAVLSSRGSRRPEDDRQCTHARLQA